jgi:hypothetical protein
VVKGQGVNARGKNLQEGGERRGELQLMISGSGEGTQRLVLFSGASCFLVRGRGARVRWAFAVYGIPGTDRHARDEWPRCQKFVGCADRSRGFCQIMTGRAQGTGRSGISGCKATQIASKAEEQCL